MDARMTASRIILSAALIATLGLVAGCGRKAPLDTGYEAGMQARKDAQDANKPLPPAPEKPVQDRKFILDGLI
jgi:predicted small lipoprotein YifL